MVERRQIDRDMEIKVSVIIPVYNAENYLRQCLDSVISQSLREIEVICVDDGSSDGSADILLEYAASDERIRIIEQKNSGPGIARNCGLAAAAGKYIIFLDADDWFEQDMLSALLDTASRNQADITICKAERFDNQTGQALNSAWMLKEEYLPGEAFSPEEIAGHVFQFTYGQVWDKLYSADFLKRAGVSFPALRCAEDTAFAYMTLLSAGRIAVLPEVKVHYRVNRDSSVSNSFFSQPEAPFEAFRLIYEFLQRSGLYTRYEKSFLNWAMEYLTWQVCNAPDDETRKLYYEMFHDTWMPQLKNSRKADIDVGLVRKIKIRAVELLPFGILNTILHIYKGIKWNLLSAS